MAERNVALVIGGTGVTGTPMVEELLLAGWPVYAVSRRAPMLRIGVASGGLTHVGVDLTDSVACRQALEALHDVTHVFYCANDPSPAVRAKLMQDVLDAVEVGAPDLRNVHMMQGTKYYGCHLGKFKVPAQEDDPRIAGSDFYYSEEDDVKTRALGKRWSFTAVRPHSVCGHARGNPLNLAVVLGIYGSIQKAIGAPFAFPGSEACYNARFNVADSELLARSAIWCSTTPGCGNHVFNVNNGDVFRWRDIWPALAESFGLRATGPQSQRLPEFLAAHSATWQRLSSVHGLQPFPYERVARWAQGDYTAPNSRFACEYDVVSDLAKARSFGFTESINSAEMFVRMFGRLRRDRVIP
jgi:nucleoside-diphosphate-sugar epimerase